MAYAGPYDLMDKDYSETFWFKEVMAKGVYVSDMFMGYRKAPTLSSQCFARMGTPPGF